jgi:hypothetical protein
MPESQPTRSFFTKIAEVNDEKRQQIIAGCRVGERLILERDFGSEVQRGAIKVMRSNGQQLGVIPDGKPDDAEHEGLSAQMNRGTQFLCRISSLTGGIDSLLGVNVEITEIGSCAAVEVPSAWRPPAAPPQSKLRWWLLVGAILLVASVIVALRRG